MKRLHLHVPSVLALSGLLAPLVAQAHLVNTGLGPFYDGLSHFMLAPEDLLPALALALWAGLNGASAGRNALFALPAAWFVGGLLGLLGLAWPRLEASPTLTAASLLVLGGMVAADLRLGRGWALGLVIVLGLLHGHLNGSAMAASRLGWVGLCGIVAALFVLVALVAASVVAVRMPWARMVVRVGGSWVAAAGLLMTGWALRAA